MSDSQITMLFVGIAFIVLPFIIGKVLIHWLFDLKKLFELLEYNNKKVAQINDKLDQIIINTMPKNDK